MILFYAKKTISFESLFRITISLFSIHSETVIFTPCGQVGTLNLFGTNSVIFVILDLRIRLSTWSLSSSFMASSSLTSSSSSFKVLFLKWSRELASFNLFNSTGWLQTRQLGTDFKASTYRLDFLGCKLPTASPSFG